MDSILSPETSDNMIKKEKVEVKTEIDKQSVTGRDIIRGFLQLNPESVAKYVKLLEALNFFDKWTDASRISFLEQFVDMYDVLDERFHEIVLQFCKIHWYHVPLSIREKFVEFLTALAIFQINHIDTVFAVFVTHLLPIPSQLGVKDPESQEKIYQLAHQSIRSVVTCNKLSNRLLLKYCIRLFPHVRQPAEKVLPFVSNLIRLAEESDDRDLRIEIWSLIVDRLLQLDAAITDLQEEESRLSFCNNNNDIYIPSNNCLPTTSDADRSVENAASDIPLVENPMEKKLDQFVALILLFVGSRSGRLAKEIIEHIQTSNAIDNDFDSILTMMAAKIDETTKNVVDCGQKSEKRNAPCPIFQLFLDGFDEHVLTSTGVHSTPFVWFYLCSLSKENCERMLEFLWEVLRSPLELLEDVRKAHNAAAFLCGFLARAKYIEFEIVRLWLGRLSVWCIEYLEQNFDYNPENTRRNNISANALIMTRHGVFYAAVQAMLFVFCYRHEELREASVAEELHSWNLDRILYQNPLNPLQHISQGVALCFLNLTRRFNFFEKGTENSSLATRGTEQAEVEASFRRRRTSIDLFFPFSFCSLKICSPLILPLMRRFPILSKPLRTLIIDEDEEEEEGEEEEEIAGDALPVDEGYEEELMCVQSVRDFSSYLIVENSAEEQHPEEMEM